MHIIMKDRDIITSRQLMEKITNSRWFNLASWGITAVLVAGMFGFAYVRVQNPSGATAAAPAVDATLEAPQSPVAAVSVSWFQQPAIERKLRLKTLIPQRPRYEPLMHTVQRGDSITAIAREFNIKPDTLLFANYNVLEDSPDGLRPGQELNVPPTDGILYQWKNGDTLDKVAGKYEANPEDVLGWPGNKIDLTDPKIQSGQWVMLPGGTRASLAKVIETAGGAKGVSGCPAGAVGRGFFAWPAANHFLSGNDYSGGHQGIDIAVSEGEPISAADGGVVSMSQGGWNYGYGNVIQIDHGNGFVTLYAHLSQLNVGKCDSVGAGQVIGLAGNTGNSFGTHLHFEIRKGGVHVNPHDYLP
jgi:murein DD-endopeptidase MepM/ murein hydrolase activator NlpD